MYASLNRKLPTILTQEKIAPNGMTIHDLNYFVTISNGTQPFETGRQSSRNSRLPVHATGVNTPFSSRSCFDKIEGHRFIPPFLTTPSAHAASMHR
jgi:hypothetical protein